MLSVWQWQWGHLLGKVAVSNNFARIRLLLLLLPIGNDAFRRRIRLNTFYVLLQTMQTEDILGAAFHPLDDNLMITHGKGHLTFWTRRKDGFFEKIDIIKAVIFDRDK